MLASSDICLVGDFDLKNAKWLNAAEPGRTKIFLLVSSCSKSAIQASCKKLNIKFKSLEHLKYVFWSIRLKVSLPHSSPQRPRGWECRRQTWEVTPSREGLTHAPAILSWHLKHEDITLASSGAGFAERNKKLLILQDNDVLSRINPVSCLVTRG